MGGFDASFRTVSGIDVYNPTTNTWHRVFNGRIKPAETHAGVAVDGAAIYFAGGFAGNLEPGRRQPISNSLWRFDTNTRRWTRLASLPRGQGAGAMVIVNRELHFFGGCTADRVTNTGLHWVFGLGKSSSIRDDGHRWVRKATLPGARDHLAGIVMKGRIYAIGGEFGHDVRHIQSNLVQCFDPKTNQWTLCARLPVPKSHIEWGTFALDGKIVVAGGQVTPQLPTRDVEMYYPDHNRWQKLTNLPAPRQGVAVQQIGDRVVMTVGGVHTDEPQRSTWLGKLRYAANGSTTPPAMLQSAKTTDESGSTSTASPDCAPARAARAGAQHLGIKSGSF
jgi:N-acetylneuraminic acid mutarotase